VLEFLEARAEGEQIDLAPDERDESNVVDLVAALEQSLAKARGDRPDREPADPAEPAEPAERSSTDYDAMTRDELYALAKQRDIPGRSSLSKPELIEALASTDRASGAA
jgi:DNA end-binding protein Ku